jgi:ubiquitin-activating enzyme E1 C
VGKPKAQVAAARIMERVAGVSVTAHYCRIEEKPADWYREFHVIALGLDSLEVRRRRRVHSRGAPHS